ncbi:MAG: dimethyl sulfoxide reductase anchor subunit family protein [Coriobacteriales bacterium]
MEMAFAEITLVLFTTLAPAGAVGYAVIALAVMLEHSDEKASALSHHLVIPLSLATLGLIGAATHLGTPANALYVLTGLGRSPLSNEMAAAVVFLLVSSTYWLKSFGRPLSKAARCVWLTAASLAGLVFVGFIAVAYSVPSIPTWSLETTSVSLWLNAMSSGPLVGIATVALAHQPFSRKTVALLVGVAAAAVAANDIAIVLQWTAYGAIATTAAQAAGLVPPLPLALITCTALCGGGVALTAVASLKERYALCGEPGASSTLRRTRRLRLSLSIGGSALCLIGCFALRFMFYMSHMTVGV